ncbi:MAG: right-handed parallel beta-helix repeat-containing protein, partial [Clostridia bacterium]|nr:right-handed parallel beta-helix repeat-containing protein [Clostridia bacterium]
MKRLISILICFAIVMTFAPAMHIAASGGVTYYVSPEGSDSSSGLSESEAWKTFSYAAKTAQAGDTVIFEDGTYNESQLTIITNSGTEFLPIVFKSKNKHGAIINYTDENSANNAKLQINGGKEYIEIRDFTFTQEEPSTDNTGDIMIRVRNSAHCKIAGNKISEIYEEGIKLSNAYDVIAEDNIITKAGHEGIDAVNAADCIIRNNKIIDCGRTGVMIKGNSRNCQIYNNTVKNTEVQMNGGGHAFTIGGQTGIIPQTTLGDWSAETGFEAYNCVFYNNIVYASEEKILNGFSFMGAKNCHAYNNTIYGVKNAFNFETTQGIANDWEWDVPNRKPVIKNNIVMNTSVAYKLTDIPENMESDYNLFNNAGLNVPTEENSVYDEDPLFTDAANGDFSIPSASPAAKAGVPLPL